MEQERYGTGVANRDGARPSGHGWAFGVAAAVSLALTIGGIVLATNRDVWSLLAAGLGGLIVTLVGWGLARPRARRASDGQLEATIESQLASIRSVLEQIAEHGVLSDRAKAVAYREKDRDALRRAIHEDIAKGDFEAAEVLCEEMENTFGYRQESERFRDEVRQQREADTRRRVNDAMGIIERATRAGHWQAAFAEASRLQQQFPDHEEVKQMPIVIEARRREFKSEMVDQWHEKVRSKDLDGAIELLRRLDLYLSPAEAEGLQESARSVFKEKLLSLKGQFGAAVREHRWDAAVRVGEEIVRDFPDTQMAREARDRLPGLRQRAAGHTPAATEPLLTAPVD